MTDWPSSILSRVVVYTKRSAAAPRLRKAIQQYNTVRPHEALDYDTRERVYGSCLMLPSADLDGLKLAGWAEAARVRSRS